MTAQIPEILILDGTSHPMTFCPPLPRDELLNFNIRHEELTFKNAAGEVDTKIVARWRDDRGRERTSEEESLLFSTACWRRYRGTWRIFEARFYLIELAGCIRLARPGPLRATWFTGVLRVPLGEQLLYVHMGFGTVYERELHIMVERGRVKGRRIYDNRGREYDENQLARTNLPGMENSFPGDRDFH